MATQFPEMDELQEEWKELYQKSLPAAARSKLPSQPIWPVHNDRSFARIILDSTIGISTPSTSNLKSPTYKNMSFQQLQASIALARQILDGEVDLVGLDNKSLELRGKRGKKIGKADGITLGKREREGLQAGDDADLHADDSVKKRRAEAEPQRTDESSPDPKISKAASNILNEDLTPWVKKIASSQKTDYQKKVLTLLCQVPRGQYTTYGAISKHLSSSPRAVGNVVRNNPFAPDVPCHRVLASGGGIGGFHGSWGRNGEAGLNDDWKRKLLREEGVKFDGRGKVVGSPWEGFK